MKTLVKNPLFKRLLLLTIVGIFVSVVALIFSNQEFLSFLIVWCQVAMLFISWILIYQIEDENTPMEIDLLEIHEVEHMSTDELIRLSEQFPSTRIGRNYSKYWGRQKIVDEFKGDLRWYKGGSFYKGH
jgi:hypothetical protein